MLRNDVRKEWANCKHKTDQVRGVPRPPGQKPHPQDAKLIDLVPAEELTMGNAPVRETIARRRSRRIFTEEALTLGELSYLLWATQGVIKVVERRDGPITFRTSPSGGARHPFETYLFITRVAGIGPGLYRYLSTEHKLLFLYADDALSGRLVYACCDQEFVTQGVVLFIWTAIPYRTEWRYSVLSHKTILLDAGHLCQNLYIASESIGAGTCAIGAYFQEEMDEILGVDGEEEFTIYAAPVGKVD